MPFPAACPEIPVADLAAALTCYRDHFGFKVDWSAEEIGLACLSRGATRMFVTSPAYRAVLGNRGPIVLWFNLDSRADVDDLHAQWQAAGTTIAEPPEANPHSKLYEFYAQDLDGNTFRVFYDFAWEER